jgi:predicted transcriptional regulator
LIHTLPASLAKSMICEKDECTGFCSLFSKLYASAVRRKHEQVYIISCMSEFSTSTKDNQATQTTLETENLIRTLPRSLTQSGICEKSNISYVCLATSMPQLSVLMWCASLCMLRIWTRVNTMEDYESPAGTAAEIPLDIAQ